MMANISTLNMDHDTWIRERKKGIGGSDSAAIVGLSPYKSAFDVYADKLSLIPPIEDNEAMRQGRDFEEYVAKRFCEATGKKVHKKNEIVKNDTYPFAFANIDRKVANENAGLECKTTNILNLKRYKDGEYPSEYYCQCVHYMAVTGADKWYLAVLIMGKEFKWFTIDRDEAEIKALMSAEKAFWENNVLKREPPAPDGRANSDEVINKIYPHGNGGNIELFGMGKRFERLSDLKKLKKDLETEQKQIEQEMKLGLGNSECGYCDKYKVSWKNQARRTLDTDALINRYCQNEDLSEFYHTTNIRVLRITEG